MHQGPTLDAPTLPGQRSRVTALRTPNGVRPMEVAATGDEPSDWAALIGRFGGGFFHTRAALPLTMGACTPLYLTFRRGAEPVGIALAGVQRCRFGSAAHVYLPTPPTEPPVDSLPGWRESLIAHMTVMRRVAEVRIGSFDARPSTPSQGETGRSEFVVDLQPEDFQAGFATTHRRHVRKGERLGWGIRPAAAAEAPALLYEAQTTAADRARARGPGFSTSALPAGVTQFFREPGDATGLALFVAEDDAGLLAAALVGWGGSRAFYIRGGSSPRGYREHAAVWLQWRIMTLLRMHGIARYNLGGTPAAAVDPGHPEHGLRRYKLAFGSDEVVCHGQQLLTRAGHMRLHTYTRALGALLRRGSPVRDASPGVSAAG